MYTTLNVVAVGGLRRGWKRSWGVSGNIRKRSSGKPSLTKVSHAYSDET